jgi:biopolymer transport protein ExbB/TolQ
MAALALGVSVAVIILALIQFRILDNETLRRYVHHEVEQVEVVLFCCALGALACKFWIYRAERAACLAQLLPSWDGRPVSVSEANNLWKGLNQLGRRLQNTYLVRRIRAILDFVRSRESTADLDDQLRTLADNDAIAQENTFSLVRFITWAIPILGFLGTVLGITAAISGVTPEVLEKNLSQVTDGLALAFDATALGLGLTMITMFLTFLVDRAEQSVLESVDRCVDEELAHRFERTGAEGGEFIEVVRQNTCVLVQATEELVRKQAEIWASAFAEAERRRLEMEQRQQKLLVTSLQEVLDKTQDTHGKRLAALEKQMVEQSTDLLERMSVFATALRDTGREQQATLLQVVQSVSAQAEALAQVQEGEKQLLRLQELLTANLTALAGAGSFEQAVHSLIAAIHMLTARTVPLPSGGTSRIGQRAA